MGLAYFFILVSSLVVVHELGHFLFAKAFGVKVLTFSLGFGPKILRFRGRETEYCVSLFPFGGYVRLLESSRTDHVMPEDRDRTFESLSVLKRVAVVLAGPAINLIFPVLLYFFVFITDGPYLPPTVGVVLPGHAADGKLLPGDRVMAIDGVDIGTFEELNRVVARSPGRTRVFRVFRDNKHVDVELTVESRMVARPFDTRERVGTIGIGSSAPASVIAVGDPESPAFRAGLRTFDLITHVAGKPVRRFMDLEQAFAANVGETVPVTYLRPQLVPDALGGLATLSVMEPGVVAVTPNALGSDLRERTGLESPEAYVAYVPRDSALWESGLRPGDKLLRLDGQPVRSWLGLVQTVDAEPMRARRIDFLRGSDAKEISGYFQVRNFNAQNWVPVAPERSVSHPAPAQYAVMKALEETWEVTRFTGMALVRLAQGRLSLEAFAGPIAIYELAAQEGQKGFRPFVWLMAFLSINLGLLNLLPVPTLDGGHLAFFAIEGLLRRPVPLRVREIAHLAGLGFLMLLIVLVFKNDIEKRWDLIVEQGRMLFGK